MPHKSSTPNFIIFDKKEMYHAIFSDFTNSFSKDKNCCNMSFPTSGIVGVKRKSSPTSFSTPSKKRCSFDISKPPQQNPIEIDEIITSSDSEDDNNTWCPSPPSTASILMISDDEDDPISVVQLPKPPLDDIESSDEEDPNLFANVSIPKTPIVDTSPSKKRWLDSVTTPEKETQASASSHPRRRYVRYLFFFLMYFIYSFFFYVFRRGFEVTRLYKLMERKKAEELAAKHIIASRQLNQIPKSNSNIVIKAGRVIGTLYKTFCISVDIHGNTREIRVIFPMEKKMAYSLEPGVTVNLIPPWQEFSFAEMPLILCSTFEVISKQSAVELKPELCKITNSKIPSKPIFCTNTKNICVSPVIDELMEEENEIRDSNNLDENYFSGEGLLWQVCRGNDNETEDNGTSLVEWFEGISISSEEATSRIVRTKASSLIIQQEEDLFIAIEFPPSMEHQIKEFETLEEKFISFSKVIPIYSTFLLPL